MILTLFFGNSCVFCSPYLFSLLTCTSLPTLSKPPTWCSGLSCCHGREKPRKLTKIQGLVIDWHAGLKPYKMWKTKQSKQKQWKFLLAFQSKLLSQLPYFCKIVWSAAFLTCEGVYSYCLYSNMRYFIRKSCHLIRVCMLCVCVFSLGCCYY